MKKKLIYSLIIAVMAGTMFAGCSKGEKTKENATIETTLAGETDNNETSDQPEQSVEADNTQNSEESNQNTSSDQPNETENATTSEKAETTTKNETTTQQNTSNMAENETTKPIQTTKPTETTKPTQTTKPTETTKPAETTTQKPSETPTTSAHTHTAGDWTVTKNATCKETGTKVKKCVTCGTQMETATVEKTGHTAGDWTVTKAATCSTDGTKVKKCTVCGVETASETIVANGTHSYYWDGDNTMRTHRCSGCSYTGVTEYNINGAWGYFDDGAASELWLKVNEQRNSTWVGLVDDWGHPAGGTYVASLNKNSELDAKAKNRAVAAALNFDHAGEQHECLAWGQATATEAKSAWVASTSHRVAMTNPDYTQGGVAVFYFDSDNSGNNLTPIYCLELGY